ncbi:MAG: class I SAM-dependent methyltransferase [Betaproteobacteria bacterium]
MTAPLQFTGERFVPGDANAKGEMWYEHWHRYHYVLPLVTGKSVLDVACGEGYGSALMSRHAAQVTGVDISPEAIAHGREAYAARSNLKLIEASCTTLPFDAAMFDRVVSFETIEHIHPQAEFLDEIRRVLKPDGVLILSCPNKAEYSDKRGFSNEFHVKELYRAELDALLSPRFAHKRWLSQRNAFVSLIAPEEPAAGGESLTVSQTASDQPAPALPALYDMVVAGNDAAVITALPLRVSVFSDAEEWAYGDYQATYQKYLKHANAELELRARCEALSAEVEALLAASAATMAPTAAPTTAATAVPTMAPVASVTPPPSSDSWWSRIFK